jgi:toxin CcdB
MAQFDVYRSPARSRATVPFVVDIQSRRFDSLPTRVVIPLMAFRARPGDEGLGLTPEFRINGRQVFLNPLEVQTLRRSLFGRPVASLADDVSSGAIINAIDTMITHAYG